MFISRLYNYKIDTNIGIGCTREIHYRRFSPSDSLSSLTILMKRIRHKKTKVTKEEFIVNIVNNEDGTDLLVLIPYDKIRVTTNKNRLTGEIEFTIENADFYIQNRKVVLRVIGCYGDYFYVCRFEYKEEQ